MANEKADIRLPGDFKEALGDLLKVKPQPKKEGLRRTSGKPKRLKKVNR